MRSLARPSFFRVFDLLVSQGNPGLKRTHWNYADADFERERHSFTSARHSIVIDIITVTRKGRRGWSLMVTKEYWWGPDEKPFKSLRWARPLTGQRNDLFGWLRAQEVDLERALKAEFHGASPSVMEAASSANGEGEWSFDDSDES